MKRIIWFILLIAAVACVTPILIQESRRQMYINETENVRQLLQQMRTRRPDEVPEKQWNQAVEWAEIVTSNVACVDYFFPLEDLKPFRVELEQKMKGPVDLNTIDWIWTDLKSGNSSGAKYAATWEAKYRFEVHGEPIPKSSQLFNPDYSFQ